MDNFEDQPSKKLKTENSPCNKKPLVIGTHSGIFHADELLAIHLLKTLPEYADSKVIRSRDAKVLETCDILVDVGAVYNKTNKFDHHQGEFTETLSTVIPEITGFDTKLSSAGLIYAHYGKTVLDKILKEKGIKANEDDLDKIFVNIYKNLIQEIDAIDNGIPICDGKQKYIVSTCLSSRISRLNPSWNESADPADMSRFEKGLKVVGQEFDDIVQSAGIEWWFAKEHVEKAIESRFTTHESGKVIELETFVPWSSHLHSIEERLQMKGEILFVIFNGGKEWRVQAVPVVPKSFICRQFLKEEWRGHRDEKLSSLAQIPGCLFVHHNGFIGGNTTREGALKMAISSF